MLDYLKLYQKFEECDKKIYEESKLGYFKYKKKT